MTLTRLASPLLSCLLGLALPWGSSHALQAADVPAPADAPAADDAAVRKQADAAAEEGKAAMRDADADPHRAVDAAIAFSHALHAYEQLKDVDAVCEMQADIYFCKKKMNLDNLQDYVAKKSAAAQADFGSAQAVMSKTVPVTEAASYLERADKFRTAHADDHYQIAIFYSEIVDRFPGTDQAHQASDVFDHEQTLYMAEVSKERAKEHDQLQNEIAQVRTNRFQQPPAVAAGSQSPIPDKDARTSALTTVKAAYKDEYAHLSKVTQKRRLARRLATEAEQSKDDAAAYYVMLDESQRLAMESEDYETILADIEHMAAVFKDFNELDAKKTAMSKLSSYTAAQSILKLLSDPTDKSANLVVGKFYCFNLNRWPDGLQMLSMGADPEMHKVAEMELNNPTKSMELKATGDEWYAASKHAANTERNAVLGRAMHWYTLAMPGMTGVSKAFVQKRLDEIENVLPVVITDWDNVTPKQWAHLHGDTLTVEARKDRTDTGILLADGQSIRIIACPSDTWTWNVEGDDFDCTAAGRAPRHTHTSSSGGSTSGNTSGGTTSGSGNGNSGNGNGNGNGNNSGGDTSNVGFGDSGWGFGSFRQGQMTYKVNSDGPEKALGIATGPGPVFLQGHNTWAMMGTGEIRVKIVPVRQDDD
jgi:hypothetical protein